LAPEVGHERDQREEDYTRIEAAFQSRADAREELQGNYIVKWPQKQGNYIVKWPQKQGYYIVK